MSISKQPSYAADIDWFFSLQTSARLSAMSWNNASMHVIRLTPPPPFCWEGYFFHSRDFYTPAIDTTVRALSNVITTTLGTSVLGPHLVHHRVDVGKLSAVLRVDGLGEHDALSAHAGEQPIDGLLVSP